MGLPPSRIFYPSAGDGVTWSSLGFTYPIRVIPQRRKIKAFAEKIGTKACTIFHVENIKILHEKYGRRGVLKSLYSILSRFLAIYSHLCSRQI